MLDPAPDARRCEARGVPATGSRGRGEAKEAVLQTLECLVLLSCRALQLAATAVVAEPPRTLLQELVLNVKVRGYRCGRERAFAAVG